MSAECHKHGTDLVYPVGSWPVGVCPSCKYEAEVVRLTAEAKRFRDALVVIAESEMLNDRTAGAMRGFARDVLDGN